MRRSHIDQLIVNDDKGRGLIFVIVIGEEDIVGPKVPVTQGINGLRLLAHVLVQPSGGSSVKKSSAFLGVFRLRLPALGQDPQDSPLRHFFQLGVHHFRHSLLRIMSSFKDGPRKVLDPRVVTTGGL